VHALSDQHDDVERLLAVQPLDGGLQLARHRPSSGQYPQRLDHPAGRVLACSWPGEGEHALGERRHGLPVLRTETLRHEGDQGDRVASRELPDQVVVTQMSTDERIREDGGHVQDAHATIAARRDARNPPAS
jgi:hypothetical protein